MAAIKVACRTCGGRGHELLGEEFEAMYLLLTAEDQSTKRLAERAGISPTLADYRLRRLKELCLAKSTRGRRGRGWCALWVRA